MLPESKAEFLFDGEVPQSARLTSWVPATWPVADGWRAVIEHFLTTEAAQHLGQFIQTRLDSGALIYPPAPFRALELTPLHQVKVVILGQDPYHGPGQAHGLAFSVPPGVRVPPSLRNIFKEVNNDPLLDRVHRSPPVNGSLERWARQGVLLLNTCLTVEDGEPASHAQKGWEALTDLLVSAVVARSSPAVFLLWGAHAQAKKVLLGPFVDASPNGCTPAPQVKSVLLALSANHPSPLSATRPPLPFIGCSHFGRVNQFLERHHQSAIDW